ncbi:carboxypeptidase-like regulatory domain-containing protein [Aeromicrobium sp. NPDC092404]|uniref:carboxypeptidase-like regulatory domain-containing protein n=1 Tax=Aeromicrobium sp. NPDC092404 TaxID=3154976 RepID=UPI00344842F4
MLTHPLRRVIATCASALLVLGLVAATSSPSQAEDPYVQSVGGMVVDAEGVGVAGISVTVYRATGNTDSPWVLDSTLLTRGDGGWTAARLPAATYRIMFNEFDDGTAAWTTWRPTPWSQTDDDEQITEFTVGPEVWVDYTRTVLHPRGGEVRGTISASYGRTLYGADIVLYDAEGNGDKPLSTTTKSGDGGRYSIRLSTRPTKIFIRTSHLGSRLVSRWVGGSTFEDAKTFTMSDGEVSEGNDEVITYLEPSTISGRVLDPEGRPVVSAEIVGYKSKDGVGGPWEYMGSVAYTRSPTAAEPELAGTFMAKLDPGRYRFKIEPFYEYGHLLRDEFYGDAATIDAAASIDHARTDQTLPDIVLAHSGGSVSGRVVDSAGKPLANVRVSSGLTRFGPSWPMAKTVTDAAGAYTIRVSSDPTTLRFVTSSAAHFEDFSLSELTVPVGETLLQADVQMIPKPIANTSTPKIYGSLSVGRSLKTAGGAWAPAAVTKNYRWYYLKGGRIRPIIGGTRSYLTLRKTDYGKRFRVRVTASHPGLNSKVVISRWSTALLRNSSMSLSVSSPSRGKIKLTAKVSASGAKATGKVRFSCGTSSAIFAAKTVTLRSEKASATLSTSYSTRMTCRANYHGNSTTKKTSRSKGVTVK